MSSPDTPAAGTSLPAHSDSPGPPVLEQLIAQIENTLLRERQGMRKKVAQIQRRQSRGQPVDRALLALQRDLQQAQRIIDSRSNANIRIEYPPNLPVSERHDDILQAVRDNQVVIIAGETGSGKTTQIPKICLELGLGTHGRIGHTQPRRLAARTVASRVAEELNVPVGEAVGYQFRFNDSFTDATRVKMMTDGVLLARIPQDRLLLEYDTLIIDEAHERSLNIDFLLGYIKSILPKRPDLKIIVTSATIDVQRFSRHFGDAPVIEVTGRNFPVDIEYLDFQARRVEGENRQDERGLASLVGEILDDIEHRQHSPHARDILMFVPGEREIRDLGKALKHLSDSVEVMPLYARLSQKEQQRIFSSRPGGKRRRLVLATNVAETSVTVPGIGFVIDTGTARISRYSVRSKLQRLPVEPVSQASANQRAGRCGRIAPGVCYRLYAEDDFAQRDEFTEPELLRTNLAAVILQMKSLALGEIDRFPFVEAPDSRQVRAGIRTLEELGALDGQGKLNATGKKLARLPVDPRLGRMLLAADERHCLGEVLVIASALAVQDPRERPAEKRQAADQQHRRFWHPRSDFLAWVNLWHYVESLRDTLSGNQLRKRLAREFLSYNRLREWRDVHRQLKLALKDALGPQVQTVLQAPAAEGDDNNTGLKPALVEAVHTALLTGQLSNIGRKENKHQYRGARNLAFFINPGSSQFKAAPKWIMAGEIVETKKIYAREVAAIEPAWVIRAAGRRVKYQYSEPLWDGKRGQVLALRATSLYGLQLASGERVPYDQVDAAEARQLFIQQGLATGDMQCGLDFWQHNTELVASVQAMEEKLRRRDLLVDEIRLAAFYAGCLPQQVNSRRSLEKWYRQQSTEEQKKLFLKREDVCLQDSAEQALAQFPGELMVDGQPVQLRYRFQPGAEDDGVTAVIPLGRAGSLPIHRFDWMVPGMLFDKCVDMFKCLPKALRKQLVPVPQLVEQILPILQQKNYAEDNVPLVQALAEQARIHRLVSIDTAEWAKLCESQLDNYCRMRFEIVDESGKLLRSGRSLTELLEQSREQLQHSVSSFAEVGFRRSGIVNWDFGELEASHSYRQGGTQMRGFPALLDEGDSVTLDLLATEAEALDANRSGVLRLLMLAMPDKVRYLKKNLCRDSRAILPFVQMGNRDDLVNDIIKTALQDRCLPGNQLPRDEAAFAIGLEQARAAVVEKAVALETILYQCLQNYREVCERLQQRRQYFELQCGDIDAQLQGLLAPGFMQVAGFKHLQDYPRYLEAIAVRLDRLSGSSARDTELCEKLASVEQPLRSLLYKYPHAMFSDPAVANFRWLIEELRVSLFAQQLKTSVPVSFERVAKAWDKINHNQYLLP